MVRQLFLKELRIQQSGIYFAIAVMLVGMLLAVLAHRVDWMTNTNRITVSTVIEVLYVLFVTPSLLYVVPVFIGAAMIAEERRIGMWEWQMAMPLGKTWQVVIKLLLGCALVFAAVFILMPLMNLSMLAAVPNHKIESWLHNDPSAFAAPRLTIALFIMMSAAYASSMLSDSYKAFWLGIVLAALFSLPILWGLRYGAHNDFIRRIPLVPVAVVYVVVMLSLVYNFYYHFRFESMSWQRIAIDVLGTVLVIIAILLGISVFLFVYANTRIYP